MIRAQLNSITRLARAGALEQAWATFHAAGLSPQSDDPDVLTVYGRLLKDRAAAESGTVREDLLNRAITAYERASALSRATYPLINAATLAFLAGRGEAATTLAHAVMALLDDPLRAAETPYWIDATRAEALLLLGRTRDAERMLRRAIEHQPEAWEDHASTLRQFAMILAEAGQPADWLDRHRPASPLYFEGILGLATDDDRAAEAVAGAVDALAPSMVVGALAAGADILVAEAAIVAGRQLHVVLPCPAELFRTTSVEPFGHSWADRFDALLEQAVAVKEMDDWQPLSDASVEVSRQAAMGLALCEAKRLQSSARALQIVGRGEERGKCMARWEALGLRLDRLELERSDSRRVTLSTEAEASALIAIPESLHFCLNGDGVDLARQEGQRAYRLPSLGEAARQASDLRSEYPDARLGLDYRAVSDARAGRWDRVLMVAVADLRGAVVLSEAAALALALHAPEANVQPMGDIRTALGDLTLYGLFP